MLKDKHTKLGKSLRVKLEDVRLSDKDRETLDGERKVLERKKLESKCKLKFPRPVVLITGGAVTLDRQPGQGSTFIVTLPTKTPEYFI